MYIGNIIPTSVFSVLVVSMQHSFEFSALAVTKLGVDEQYFVGALLMLVKIWSTLHFQS